LTDNQKIRDLVRACAGLLDYTGMGRLMGIASAEPRIHPGAPGELGVRVEYADGLVVWLVAEATQPALDMGQSN